LGDKLCIFSGSAHPELAEEICALRGVPLSPSVTRHFHNDNLYVQLSYPTTRTAAPIRKTSLASRSLAGLLLTC
jgi:phosphoribosylpyrophosphate synthetase